MAFTSILIASLVGSGVHPFVAISVVLLIGALFGTAMGCLIRWFELPPFLVLILGLIQTLITFQGNLNTWWTRIAVGILVLVFILLQNVITSASRRLGETQRR